MRCYKQPHLPFAPPTPAQPLYTEDWIGLKRLDQAGRLVFEEAPGQHMQFSLDWFGSNVVDRYLR